MTTDTSHLVALYTRLSHEREYLAQEKTEAGRAFRNVWIKQIKSEIADEETFLGIGAVELNDDELLKELMA